MAIIQAHDSTGDLWQVILQAMMARRQGRESQANEELAREQLKIAQGDAQIRQQAAGREQQQFQMGQAEKSAEGQTNLALLQGMASQPGMEWAVPIIQQALQQPAAAMPAVVGANAARRTMAATPTLKGIREEEARRLNVKKAGAEIRSAEAEAGIKEHDLRTWQEAFDSRQKLISAQTELALSGVVANRAQAAQAQRAIKDYDDRLNILAAESADNLLMEYRKTLAQATMGIDPAQAKMVRAQLTSAFFEADRPPTIAELRAQRKELYGMAMDTGDVQSAQQFAKERDIAAFGERLGVDATRRSMIDKVLSVSGGDAQAAYRLAEQSKDVRDEDLPGIRLYLQRLTGQQITEVEDRSDWRSWARRIDQSMLRATGPGGLAARAIDRTVRGAGKGVKRGAEAMFNVDALNDPDHSDRDFLLKQQGYTTDPLTGRKLR